MISNTRKILTEALNPLTKITNSIVKKLNYIESSLILKAKDFEQAKDFILKTESIFLKIFLITEKLQL